MSLRAFKSVNLALYMVSMLVLLGFAMQKTLGLRSEELAIALALSALYGVSVAMFVYTVARHTSEGRLKRLRRQVFARIAHFELHASMSSQYFMRRLQQECHRSRRYQLPLTLVVMQSRMEDQEGQPDLERQLKNSVLTMVAVEMRREDVVGQLGELEYGFYLPHTAREGALLVQRRVMVAFAGYSPCVGLAEYGEDGTDASSLVEAAREDAERRWLRENAAESGAKARAA